MNRTSIPALAAAMLGLASSAPAALVAHYNVDNNTTNLGTRGAAANGTLNGATYSTTVVSPYPGSTHSLDLNTGVSNMSVTPAQLTVNGSYTAAVWVNVDTMPAAGSTGNIFGAYQAASPFQHNFLLRVVQSTNQINFISRDSDGSTVQLNSAFTLDTWNHFAVTFNSATSSAQMFLNGVSIGTAAMTAGTTPGFGSFPAQTHAGLGGFTGADSMNGFVDDARLYDEVLTQTQIQALLVPEPSAALLGGLGALALLRRRRA
ncbi:MAG: LamG domain-containing protein [Verrucomicrobiota bacterium]